MENRLAQIVGKVALFKPSRTEQIIGREGKTATFIWRCLVSLTLRVIGFAPRQLNRWAFPNLDSNGKLTD